MAKSPTMPGTMSSDADAMEHWLDSLAEYQIKAVMVLGPDPVAANADREVVAVYPEAFRGAATSLANSTVYGAEWRNSKSSLVAWRNINGVPASESGPWVEHLLDLGAFSMVRVDFPMPFNRGFECFMLGGKELVNQRDVHAIAYSAQMVWPTLKEEVVVRRFDISPREREVLAVLADGYTHKEAGTVLGCTERTITFHVSNVMAKLRCHNKGSLIQRACSLGLI